MLLPSASKFEGWIHRCWEQRGLISHLLLPVSWLYGLLVNLRRGLYRLGWRRTTRLPVPVIVVGNIVVGGSGKTPLVGELIRCLRANGWRPGVLSRGYGVSIDSHQAALAEGAAADPEQIGDEAALLARTHEVPVGAHPNRVLAATALLAWRPAVNLLISDDGLQHLALARDITLIPIDRRSLDQPRLLPAGPLRESWRRLRQADALLTPPDLSLPAALAHLPRFNMRLVLTEAVHLVSGMRIAASTLANAPQIRGQRCLAAAGIARPERFFNDLEALGLECRQLALPDHYSFKRNPFQNCAESIIFITAKDAIKCAGLNDSRIWWLDTRLELDPACCAWLLSRLRAA